MKDITIAERGVESPLLVLDSDKLYGGEKVEISPEVMERIK
jgi:hypothetical protein